MATEVVVLRGGLSVPAEVLECLLRMEARGITVRRAATGTLRVSPASQVTAAERRILATAPESVAAILAYVDREGWR